MIVVSGSLRLARSSQEAANAGVAQDNAATDTAAERIAVSGKRMSRAPWSNMFFLPPAGSVTPVPSFAEFACIRATRERKVNVDIRQTGRRKMSQPYIRGPHCSRIRRELHFHLNNCGKGPRKSDESPPMARNPS